MQTIQVNGGNLYQIAAQYLGDASQWIRIAIQNGLSDPFLSASTPITITIPDVNPQATGGVPPQ
ncbi:MAG TPA: hypothetical protein PLT25_08775 [Acidocella sp.]|nr:hypothetical protein [Acidocella sp.]